MIRNAEDASNLSMLWGGASVVLGDSDISTDFGSDSDLDDDAASNSEVEEEQPIPFEAQEQEQIMELGLVPRPVEGVRPTTVSNKC